MDSDSDVNIDFESVQASDSAFNSSDSVLDDNSGLGLRASSASVSVLDPKSVLDFGFYFGSESDSDSEDWDSAFNNTSSPTPMRS